MKSFKDLEFRVDNAVKTVKPKKKSKYLIILYILMLLAFVSRIVGVILNSN